MATAPASRARDHDHRPAPAADDLELPRPLRLLRIAGWSLAESLGLPVAAYLLAARLDDRDAGLVAGLAVIWLTAVIRKAATGSVPGLLTISALVLTGFFKFDGARHGLSLRVKRL